MSRSAKRSAWPWRLGALIVVAFGLGCLNYTSAFGFDHHVEVAREYGMPEPSYGIFVTGAFCAVLGAIVLGATFGRRAS